MRTAKNKGTGRLEGDNRSQPLSGFKLSDSNHPAASEEQSSIEKA